MILGNTGNNVEVHGVQNQSFGFGIEMNAKAFRVLSDSLYKDKIGSIIREISCNAYDAHVMAGKAVQPFIVHLPDSYEPWFSVQDFGVGLTEEAVRTVITRYFKSTKDQSNDTIGAFGLGAKTPFSYTDQFTITSIVDGVKSVYSAFISAMGMPDCLPISSEPTEEGNGVTIQMAVETKDFQKFQTAARQQLQFFNPTPDIQNLSYGEFVSYEKVLESNDILLNQDGVVLFSGRPNGLTTGHTVMQGSVGYSIDIETLRDAFNMTESQKIAEPAKAKIYESARVFLEAARSSTMVVQVPIGSIGVIASREGIEYTDQTINTLANKLSSFSEKLASELVETLEGMPNWQMAQYVSNTPLIRTFVPNINSYFNTDFGIPRHVGGTIFNIPDSVKLEQINRYRKNLTDCSAVDISDNTELKIYYIDAGCKYQKQRMNLIRNMYSENGYIFSTKPTKEVADEVSRLAGGIPLKLVPLSSIYYAPAPRVRGNAGPRTMFLKDNGNCELRHWERYDTEDEVPVEDTLYIVHERLQPINASFQRQRTLLQHLGVLDGYDIIAMNAKEAERYVKANPTAKSFDTFFAEQSDNLNEYLKIAVNRSATYKAVSSIIPSLYGYDEALKQVPDVQKAIKLVSKFHKHYISDYHEVSTEAFRRDIKPSVKESVVNCIKNVVAGRPGLVALGYTPSNKLTQDQAAALMMVKV